MQRPETPGARTAGEGDLGYGVASGQQQVLRVLDAHHQKILVR
jgi:hypothetical protein